MTANIAEYGIEIGFEKALPAMKKLMSVNKKMNKMNEDSLSRQIQLQKRLNALMKAGVVGSVISKPVIPAIHKTATSPVTTKQTVHKDAPIQDSHVKAREKAMNTAYKERVALQKAIDDLKKFDRLFTKEILTAEARLWLRRWI